MITPDFKVIADSIDITEAIKKSLLSLRITDEAGIKSDKVEIKLDDRNGKISMPKTGATLEVFLGYKETTLVRMGLYIVDEVSVESPPQSMIIRAHAADLRETLKAPRTKTWGEVTLGDVVNTIASEHALTPRISKELEDFKIPYLTQTEESDLHLLTRLARNHGAITKPVHGNLLFVPKGESKSVSGILIPAVTLNVNQITRWQATFTEREKYGSVEASWHNKETANKEKVKTGDGKPTFTLRHTYDNAQLALQDAKATLERLKRGTGKLNLALPGNTQLMAEGKINLVEMRIGVDGIWNITQVEHVLNNSGYQCRINAEINQSNQEE